MPHGVCKLCLLEKDLRRSHLMAKSLYKKSGSDDPKQPHPLVRTKKGARPSSYQVQDYVFCHDCEQRFGKEGEDYMMRLVTRRDGSFPLLEMLERVKGSAKGSYWTAYSITDAPSVQRDKIAYFVASIFYRASVHKWKHESGEIISIDLGAENNETLRQYLLGKTGFPTNAWIATFACTDGESQTMFVMPDANAKKDRAWLAIMRGFIFMFAMGVDPPGYISRYCIMNSPQRWITVRNCSYPHKIWNYKEEAPS
ncbi:MAG TPA: hypothetical protein VF938_13235 [Candidatus Angelobacter sp.]